MRLFVFILMMVTTIYCRNMDEEWNQYKISFKKTYDDEREEQMRRTIFEQHLKQVEEHNQKYKQGLVTYKMQLNEFADMTTEEIKKFTNGVLPRDTGKNVRSSIFSEGGESNIPSEVNWVRRGAVTPVKDQGSMGNSFEYAVIGALEAQYFIKNDILIELTVNNLQNCSLLGFNHKQPILDDDILDLHCKYEDDVVLINIQDFYKVPDEPSLQKHIAETGPIIAVMNVKELLSYTNGIISSESCDPKELNHAVLIVGYGRDEKEEEYYLVKNSWGESWGENGYFRIARNKDNVCGIASLALYPILESILYYQ